MARMAPSEVFAETPVGQAVGNGRHQEGMRHA